MKTKVEIDWETKLSPYIEKRWLHFLLPFFKTTDVFAYLTTRKKVSVILPEQENIFKAFKLTPFDKVRVVILGENPYNRMLFTNHSEADGLAFSYTKFAGYDLHLPTELCHIRNEIENDVAGGDLLDFKTNLEEWAKQGVLLVNMALTTEVDGERNKHKKLWEPFTGHVMRMLNDYTAGTIFCFWGYEAQQYKAYIDQTKHITLEAASPQTEAFYGSGQFSKINRILKDSNNEEIKWI